MTWMMGSMEVLGSPVLLRPSELARSHRFYRDTLGLATYREFGSPDAPGLVFFLGNGLLEVSGRATEPPGDAIALWIQVRDIRDEHRRLVGAGVTVLREPRREVWAWRRCGSRTRMEYASSWSRSRRIIHSAGTNATYPPATNELARRLTPLAGNCAMLAAI
jgi:catechol 2,3-dioxygenase-like lactoylglutathione lyase family enzyme